jgi:hypothetical protein
MNLKEKALEIAITQLGVQEDKNKPNTGKEVNEYLKSIGLNGGYSWCMAFIYWCFSKSAYELKISNPLIKTGGVLVHWNKADKKYRVVTPQPGDIFIMDFGKGLGHTGIVESSSDTHINTIEGNSNDEGSREGHEVCRRKRPKTSIKGYLRY